MSRTEYEDYTNEQLAFICESDTQRACGGGLLWRELAKRLRQLDEQTPEVDKRVVAPDEFEPVRCGFGSELFAARIDETKIEVRQKCLSLANSNVECGAPHEKIIEAAKAFEQFVLGTSNAN